MKEMESIKKANAANPFKAILNSSARRVKPNNIISVMTAETPIMACMHRLAHVGGWYSLKNKYSKQIEKAVEPITNQL